MDAVALQHVKKSYTSYSSEIVITGQTRQSRTRQVLRDLSVRFPIGQLTVIVGRSGCGKSTLLKLLAGKEQPDAGQIDMPQGWHSALLSPDPYVITWTNVQRNVAMLISTASSTTSTSCPTTSRFRAITIRSRS